MPSSEFRLALTQGFKSHRVWWLCTGPHSCKLLHYVSPPEFVSREKVDGLKLKRWFIFIAELLRALNGMKCIIILGQWGNVGRIQHYPNVLGHRTLLHAALCKTGLLRNILLE